MAYNEQAEQADHLTFMLVRDCLIFITECNLLFSGFILDSDQRTSSINSEYAGKSITTQQGE